MALVGQVDRTGANLTLSFRRRHFSVIYCFPNFAWGQLKKKNIYDFSIFIYLCFSLQSSYAGAYLEDKLSFYNKHMEKYGQFTGKSRKKRIWNIYLKYICIDFDGNANGSSLDCLNLIVQSINKSTTSPIQNKATPSASDTQSPPSSGATAPTSLHVNFKRKCST